MKKLFTFAAMLFAAMALNAQEVETITCAKAVELMPAQKDAETEVEYTVVGYVTKLLSNPSEKNGVVQQRFWMDDNKGSAETVNCYWCNLPEEAVENGLNVGDKIAVTGKIINYNNKPELKNAPIVILESASVVVETYDVNVCEAIEEGSSLNAGDMSTDIFRVHGRLKGADNVNSSGKHTFDMACGEEVFQAYNCAVAEGVELGKGDSVIVTGKLLYYNGEKVEISGGTVELIEKSQVEVVITDVTVAEAIAVAMALEKGASTEDLYAVTGLIDSVAFVHSEKTSVSFFMTDDMSNRRSFDFEAYSVKCTPEQCALVKAGAKVKVTATLKRYYKAAIVDQENPENNKPEIDLAETNGGSLEILIESAVENVTNQAKTVKRIENGQVVFIRDGVRFNVLGTEIR